MVFLSAHYDDLKETYVQTAHVGKVHFTIFPNLLVQFFKPKLDFFIINSWHEKYYEVLRKSKLRQLPVQPVAIQTFDFEKISEIKLMH